MRASRCPPFTGSLGSVSVAPVTPARLAVLFVNDIEDAAERLGLRPAEAGTNVILVEPFDPVVYERDREQEGITYVALSQNAADLLTSLGRGPNEAEELLEWMARNTGAWRADYKSGGPPTSPNPYSLRMAASSFSCSGAIIVSNERACSAPTRSKIATPTLEGSCLSR